MHRRGLLVVGICVVVSVLIWAAVITVALLTLHLTGQPAR